MLLPVLMQNAVGVISSQVPPNSQFIITIGYSGERNSILLIFTIDLNNLRLFFQCSGRSIVQSIINSSRIGAERLVLVYAAQLRKLRYILIVLVLNRYPNRVRLFYRTFVSARGSKYYAHYHAEDLYYSSIHNL